ncbi:MAG: cyclic lactone autoinducer peptide [Hungatella sp.]|jgi:cyclic lactone autoinducer peptide|nr:cyclic lactone autoinducer peptide [Hungatella sp.]MDR1550550.1 cyclic lactone autoinducer peptide [Hungatella sp.]MDR1772139.1 cyclic lactone autoinducer peptide [Hungatella sp.]MDR2025920.1 cyclic lactone autoinducer peptide [Hungatella sp.]
MKKILCKYGHIIAALALVTASLTTNMACGSIYYQPKAPESAKKLKKFRK